MDSTPTQNRLDPISEDLARQLRIRLGYRFDLGSCMRCSRASSDRDGNYACHYFGVELAIPVVPTATCTKFTKSHTEAK